METGTTEGERSTGGTAARGDREAGKGKRGRLSSQNRRRADERKRAGRENAEKKGTQGTRGRQALAEQLWERSEEGRKETNRKPSKRIREGSLRDRAERAEENREARAELGTVEATVRRRREALKGRNRG